MTDYVPDMYRVITVLLASWRTSGALMANMYHNLAMHIHDKQVLRLDMGLIGRYLRKGKGAKDYLFTLNPSYSGLFNQ